ncbi:MAG: histidine phosphatase family protein, partial [Phycisphaerales bacterium]
MTDHPDHPDHPNPPELWLLRHAATDWSENGRHTGCRTDLPLNAAGRAAAMPLRDALERISFAAVLSSPLSRCMETCRLAGRGDTMKTDPDLVEWD